MPKKKASTLKKLGEAFKKAKKSVKGWLNMKPALNPKHPMMKAILERRKEEERQGLRGKKWKKKRM